MPSRYLLPTNILGAAAALGMTEAFVGATSMPKGYDDAGGKVSKWGQAPNESPGDAPPPPGSTLQNGRFTAEDRQKYEDILDSYYFPFYITDLRTNEILAMSLTYLSLYLFG